MIRKGIGIDCCTMERVRKILESDIHHHWLERIFTETERIQFQQKFPNQSPTQKNNFYLHIAGLFAAKEAIAKATKKGLMGEGRLSWQEIEITYSELGAPMAKLYSTKLDHLEIDISITHENGLAFAVAIIW